MKRLLSSRLGWFGVVAILAAIALFLRDASMPDDRVLPGGVLIAALLALAGVLALALSHLRSSRLPRRTPSPR